MLYCLLNGGRSLYYRGTFVSVSFRKKIKRFVITLIYYAYVTDRHAGMSVQSDVPCAFRSFLQILLIISMFLEVKCIIIVHTV